MKNAIERKSFSRAMLFYTAFFLLSLVSFNSYSQTTPPAGTTPPTNQIPRTPPESQPAPPQTYPAQHKPMGKDTIKHLRKDTTHTKPDTVKRMPPPHK